MFICSTTYAILDLANLSYLSRIGISAIVSFWGIEKTYDFLQKLIDLWHRKDRE